MLMNRTTVFNHIKKLEEEIKHYKQYTTNFTENSYEHYTAKQAVAEREVELARLTEELKKMVGQ